MLSSQGKRFFVGAATTTYRPETELADRPQLTEELTRARQLFAGMGYQVVDGFGIGLGVREFKDRLRELLLPRTPDEVVVVYYTGHGLAHGDELLLPMADTTGDISYTSLRASQLTGELLDGYQPGEVLAQQLLYVLDTCYAGSAVAPMLGGAVALLNRLRRLASNASVAVLVAARDYEQATPGAFTQALTDAVESQATAGFDVPHLALEPLVEVINADTPSHQHARMLYAGDKASEFFPNPRYDRWFRDLDVRTRATQHQKRARQRERDDHVTHLAQGLDAADGRDDLWLFTGRHHALRTLRGWASSTNSPSTLIVTGHPGSGKSALLARMDVLADPRRRSRIPGLFTVPGDTIPEDGVIRRFIHARGHTPQDLLAALAEACHLPDIALIDTVGKLLDHVRHQTVPLTVIIDAIDEAVGSREDHDRGSSPIVEQVLGPLVSAIGRTPLRLVLGTRRHLIDAIGQPALIVNLDDPEYADPDSVRAYARRCLTDLIDTSPYRFQPAAYLDAVAEAIAANAGDSFLITLITARSLALHGEQINPYDPVWRASLPSKAADAIRDDLDRRLGRQASRARNLLLPLAYAESSGLPWADLWPALATALTGEPCRNKDLDWLIDNAGYYIIETSHGPQSVYRLYHESLAEHLRQNRNVEVDQTIIVDMLTARVPRLSNGTSDWTHADPYTRSTIATHAANTSRLDDLLKQPRFLLGTAPGPLMTAVAYTRTPQAHATADAYRRAGPRLHAFPPHQHASYLQLAARCARAPHLAEAINASELSLPWITNWARWRLEPVHQALRGHTGTVWSVAVGSVEGRPVVVSGSDDGTVRIWDAVTGNPIGDPLTGHAGSVQSVAFGNIDGRAVIVSGSTDRTMRVWDAVTGDPIGDPLTGHTGSVLSVAVGSVDGRAVVVSGSSDETVRVWDALTGDPIGDPLTGHTGSVQSVAVGSVEGRPVVVSGSTDRTMRIWDAVTGTPMGDPLTGHTGAVLSVAVGAIEGRAVVVSGSEDRAVRIWDALTGSFIGDPFTDHTDAVLSVAVGGIDGRAVIVSGSTDRTMRLWDAITGTPIGEPVEGHTGAVFSVAVGSVDGRAVVVSGSTDETVRVWDALTGNPIGDPLTGHTGAVWSVAFGNIDGRAVIVSGSTDKTVRVWDAVTGTPIRNPFLGHTAAVSSVAFGSVSGRAVIVSGSDDGTVRIWDAVTGNPTGDPLTGDTGAVSSVAFGDLKGRAVIVSGNDDGTVRIWDALTGNPIGDPYNGHTDSVRSVAVGSVDGRAVVVSGSTDETVRVWDALTGNPIGDPLTGHTGSVLSVAIGSVDGRAAVVSGSSDETVRVWDAVSGNPIGDPFTGHVDSVWSVAFCDLDGHAVIVSGDNRAVRIWDAVSGTPIRNPFLGRADSVWSVAVGIVDGRPAIASGDNRTVHIWDATTGSPIGDPHFGHTDSVRSMASGNVNGRAVIASGSTDKSVRVWDVVTGNPVGDPFIGHAGSVLSVAFGYIDGRTVVVSGGTDETVLVWDVVTGNPVGDPFTGHAGSVLSVAFGNIDGRAVIVSGSDDRTVRIWDVVTGNPIGAPLAGHAGSVRSVAVGSVSGRAVIASGSTDKSVRVWDVVTGNPVGAPLVGHAGSVLSVAFGNIDGRPVIASGSGDRSLRIWDAVTGSPIGNPLIGHTGSVWSVAFGDLDGRAVIVSGSADDTVCIWDTAVMSAQPISVYTAAPITSTALIRPNTLVLATDLGLVSLDIQLSRQFR